MKPSPGRDGAADQRPVATAFSLLILFLLTGAL